MSFLSHSDLSTAVHGQRRAEGGLHLRRRHGAGPASAFGGLFTGSVGLYNTHGLTGKTYDAASGLMDYAARWYDPTVGRFTQVDPFSGWLTVPMSQHRYSYVYNNPVMNTDPTGMATKVTVTPGPITQSDSVTISWKYDYEDHPTTLTITFGGQTVATATFGSARSGSHTWSTSTSTTPGSYSVTVTPDDAPDWPGGGPFTVVAASGAGGGGGE